MRKLVSLQKPVLKEQFETIETARTGHGLRALGCGGKEEITNLVSREGKIVIDDLNGFLVAFCQAKTRQILFLGARTLRKSRLPL
jgi:hypothetical protein